MCNKISKFVQSRLINDPIVLNALNPQGVSKKHQSELYAQALSTLKDKENRIHPFGQAELREELEGMEREQELQRRNTRGKSIRMSMTSASEL